MFWYLRRIVHALERLADSQSTDDSKELLRIVGEMNDRQKAMHARQGRMEQENTQHRLKCEEIHRQLIERVESRFHDTVN